MLPVDELDVPGDDGFVSKSDLVAGKEFEETKGGQIMTEKTSVLDEVMDRLKQVIDENPKLATYVEGKVEEYTSRVYDAKESKGEIETLDDLVRPSCKGSLFSKNCKECCKVFTDPGLRRKFGYTLSPDDVRCECHDICVQDVRLICTKRRTVTIPIGGLDTSLGCRGGRTIDGTPMIDNVRIFCAEEELQTTGPNRCLQVNNEVGVEVTLKIDCPSTLQDIFIVHRTIDRFSCRFDEFFKFPSGNSLTADQFRDKIKFIDGSCKTIIIENFRIVVDTSCPRVVVDLLVVDKLWKHENLLVSALKPYPRNITVKQEFNATHRIGPCDQPCPELGPGL